MDGEPLDTRRGWLKNGNRPGDFRRAPRCGAKNRRGLPCQCAAMRGKRRCRLHGGLSTGPRTPEGLERLRRSRTKHGWYSQAAKAQRLGCGRPVECLLSCLVACDDAASPAANRANAECDARMGPAIPAQTRDS